MHLHAQVQCQLPAVESNSRGRHRLLRVAVAHRREEHLFNLLQIFNTQATEKGGSQSNQKRAKQIPQVLKRNARVKIQENVLRVN